VATEKRFSKKSKDSVQESSWNQNFYNVYKTFFQGFADDLLESGTQQKEYIQKFEKLNTDFLSYCKNLNQKNQTPPATNDKRFSAPEWENIPFFNYIKENYLINYQYMMDLIKSVKKIPDDERDKIIFYAKQILDAVSPTNFPFTNPEILKETIKTNGQNLFEGYLKLIQDQTKDDFLTLPHFTNLSAFEVGKNLATTEGKVIFQNYLFQLIYYKPRLKSVYEIPLLIVPPWINKYYIFDLQEENSFVKWALDQGIQVFMISWVNPDATYANVNLQNYIIDGVGKAVDCVKEYSKTKSLNLLGYCAGGLLTSALSAYLAKIPSQKDTINSLTLLATPIDFEKMGDLKFFVSKNEISKIKQEVKKTGFLPGAAMTKVFGMLRAKDLIWANYVEKYFLNKMPKTIDFLYWNCDTTNIPATMHIEYLEYFFVKNILLKKNSYKIDDVSIDIGNFKKPIFAFATKSDHIVPWRSAFAIKNICKNTTLVLGASGHVAGIINPQSSGKYSHWIDNDSENYDDSVDWLKNAREIKGSWWSTWMTWLHQRSGKKISNTEWRVSNCIEKAPGSYVLKKS
jgi:polyhydroxyalkanoate synthase